jgi:hypothetical protein
VGSFALPTRPLRAWGKHLVRWQASSLSRRTAPEFIQEITVLDKTEDAGKAGRWPRPRPACKKISRQQSSQIWSIFKGPESLASQIAAAGTNCMRRN